MADSTSNLTQMTSGQGTKEVTLNALIDAASPGTLFGRNAITSAGLTWGFFGGKILVDGVVTNIANGTVVLSASLTNFVEVTRAGAVSVNTTSFTAGRIPLYTIVTGVSTVTSYTDQRLTSVRKTGRLVLAMANVNQTLTAAASLNDIIELTGALSALRDVIVPLAEQQWTVFANTTGGFGVRVIGPTGTGITIADTRRAIVYSDGTNVVRVSADV